MKIKLNFLIILSLFLLPIKQAEAGSFEIIKKHIIDNSKNYKIGAAITATVGGFCILKSILNYKRKISDIKKTLNESSSEKELKQLNDSNQTALCYTTTLMNEGLTLQLDKKYKTHWTKEKRDKFKEIVTLFPNELLSNNKKLEKVVEEEGSSLITPEWFERESQKNPLFFLGECTTGYCPVTRFNTTAREELENQILEITKNNFKDFNKKESALNYTSFASGSLFPDLIILTKLMLQGFEKINVNLIDIQYDEYIEILKQRGKSVALDIFDKEIIKRGYWLRAHTYRLIQFLEWFSSETKISINIYGSVDSYIQECLSNHDIKSDIIVGIDFIQDFPDPIIDFRQLVFCGLKKNGYAFNLIGYLISDISYLEIYKKMSEPSKEEINFVLTKLKMSNPNINEDFKKFEEINKKNFKIEDFKNPKISMKRYLKSFL